MSIHTVSIELTPDRVITIETGKLAGLAGGSVTVRQGDTIVLCAACADDPREGIDFFPLQVDYREKFAAAGRMPGGFFKREGRPSEKEILTSRMTDRPLRALFPKGFKDDTQIQALLLSADGDNEADTLVMLGASAALAISDIPFLGPCGSVRVGRVNGEFIANPTHTEMEESDLDLLYSGVDDKVIMIEGGGDEVSEEVLRDACSFANEIVKKMIAAMNELQAAAGKPKYEPTLDLVPENIQAAVADVARGKFGGITVLPTKQERQSAIKALFEELALPLVPQFVSDDLDEDEAEKKVRTAFNDEFEQAMRDMILEEGKRMDGRGLEEVRPLSAEVGVLPRTHGTGLFSRGETQALVLTTLGTGKDTQGYDGITEGASGEKSFFLHYNFPNFSVGETGRIMGPGRREIGHGALAERSIARMMPKEEENYPYSIRCVSEIMSSNGSTSMASICGASLSLMDAGVPLKKAIAGISCGLITKGDRHVLITDILGAEDHYGDMDFKVAGTADGITGFQLDLKIPGVSIELLYQAMLRDKTARMQILDVMNAAIDAPREEMSPYAPRIHVMMIDPEKIGAVIGPGGSVIREITSEHDVQIDIEDDGSVKIFATDQEKMAGAVAAVEAIVAEVEVGKIYRGKVVTIKDFGAFVEVLPGQDGLLHISELANYRVNKVEDVVNIGDKVTVKCIDIDDRGRVRLSRKAALEELDD